MPFIWLISVLTKVSKVNKIEKQNFDSIIVFKYYIFLIDEVKYLWINLFLPLQLRNLRPGQRTNNAHLLRRIRIRAR